MYKQEQDVVEIISKEQKNFLQYIRRRIKNISDMDAEDIVADVVFNVYNKVDIQYHIENILAYMYRSIKNKMIDYLRQPSRAISLYQSDEVSGRSIVEFIVDRSADIETKMLQEELRNQLYGALMKLDRKQREVWIATEIEGYTYKELAAKWGEPIGTLLSRKSRATKILRKLLKNNV
ncbi:RNA polymerase sigma factor [Pelosinus propionicus]|uniref:RNA polymerase sigma factor, sigma-70 family n=1 Tax=Pelosinus propionicus DSM 13327 TaxID=1123291 RepID=A0A1I4IC27_9FIRM|nr:RNA polymerase sigma factor [Pelosinus propionicus]SFL51311.1 RNA polymerase sigma factor, sigma-70 family [Pelosinus propionicus DSM 13327]